MIRGIYIDDGAVMQPVIKKKKIIMFGGSFIVSPITESGEGENKITAKKVWIRGGTYSYNKYLSAGCLFNRRYTI